MDIDTPPRDPGPSALDARLRALHAISMELSRAPDLDGLLKAAVELCTSRLGFDRIGIWFLDPADPGMIVGTWGTDEAGRPRDENGIRLPINDRDTPEELLGGSLPFLILPGDEVYNERRKEVGRSDKAIAPLWDGSRILGEIVADNLLSLRPIEKADGEILVLFARTIAHLSALKRSEAALRESVESKALLLRELRHRTKNSFALISSLISLEAHRSVDPAFAETLHKLRDRVSVLTSLYGRLDAAAGIDRVKLDGYLGKIAADLLAGYGADARSIRLERSMESLEAAADLAVPLGLIVNELVTDSLKHAFPGEGRGSITLSLAKEGEGTAAISVSDDGVGLPEDLALRRSARFGLALVDTLCSQIHAELSIGPGPGASFTLRFPI